MAFKRHPGDPSQEEVDRRNFAHCNFMSWCKLRFEAQGVEDPHPQKSKSESDG